VELSAELTVGGALALVPLLGAGEGGLDVVVGVAVGGRGDGVYELVDAGDGPAGQGGDVIGGADEAGHGEHLAVRRHFLPRTTRLHRPDYPPSQIFGVRLHPLSLTNPSSLAKPALWSCKGGSGGAEDDRHSWHLWTVVNGEDLDEVGDLVIDRQEEMLAEEHIPIHVIPTRSCAQQGSYARANVKRTG
jgi:hypothetical protein